MLHNFVYIFILHSPTCLKKLAARQRYESEGLSAVRAAVTEDQQVSSSLHPASDSSFSLQPPPPPLPSLPPPPSRSLPLDPLPLRKPTAAAPVSMAVPPALPRGFRSSSSASRDRSGVLARATLRSSAPSSPAPPAGSPRSINILIKGVTSFE